MTNYCTSGTLKGWDKGQEGRRQDDKQYNDDSAAGEFIKNCTDHLRCLIMDHKDI